ncbi:hypothetical protein CR513_37883, partial [Mucuna pruriens]
MEKYGGDKNGFATSSKSYIGVVLEGGQLVFYFLLGPLKSSHSDRFFKCKGFPIHICIKRFPTLRKSKLLPRGINDNAYALDMPQDFGGSCIFNVFGINQEDQEESQRDLA